MSHGTLILASALALAVSAGAAEAKSIKSLIPRDALVAFCADAGIGEKTAQFTLPDGSTISGTIHCEDEDLQVAEAGDDLGGHGELEPGGDDGEHRGPGGGGDSSGPGGGGSDDGDGHDAGDDHGGHHGDDD